MAELTRFVPAVILAAGLGLLGLTHDQVRPTPVRPIASILDTVAGFDTKQLEVDSSSRRVAGMDEYVNRVFLRDTNYVFSLYVGYYTYQTQGKSIHSPRNCLPGAGWEPVESAVLPIASAPGIGSRDMNKYILANQGAYAAVYYWYQGRGRIESNEYTVKYNLMRDAALYGRTEEALVRLVIPLDTRGDRSQEVIRREITRADSIATSLAPRLAREVSAALPPAPQG
ncbi:MAG: EpsI family protein [Gemmatimonadaceae bacterium]|nr:EpsI family protein [Gemmatimonadaceae bacterium]